MRDPLLDVLDQTLCRKMPICREMGIQAVTWEDDRLAMEMPLAPNRNHQDTAFAGSLNALCTVVGWGTVFLLLGRRGIGGNIVIRRGAIRYLRPVTQERILARAVEQNAAAVEFFFDLLGSKGMSKIDVDCEISDDEGALVTFAGAYVVQAD